jgi:hypothetical protein
MIELVLLWRSTVDSLPYSRQIELFFALWTAKKQWTASQNVSWNKETQQTLE